MSLYPKFPLPNIKKPPFYYNLATLFLPPQKNSKHPLKQNQIDAIVDLTILTWPNSRRADVQWDCFTLCLLTRCWKRRSEGKREETTARVQIPTDSLMLGKKLRHWVPLKWHWTWSTGCRICSSRCSPSRHPYIWNSSSQSTAHLQLTRPLYNSTQSSL